MKTGIVLANEFGGMIRPIIAGQLHRPGLQVQPYACFDEFFPRPIVVGIECQLQQFDVGLLYVGHASSWDEIIYRGDLASHDFLAFYVKNNRVLAVAGMNRDHEMAAAEELLRLGLMPTREQLQSNDRSLAEILKAQQSINAAISA